MSKHEKSKTVVVGGASDVKQQYCGIVGGQSTDFTTIDTEVKVCINNPSLGLQLSHGNSLLRISPDCPS